MDSFGSQGGELGLLDTDRAAELLTVKPKTLRNWRAAGTGPTFIKVGKAVRYRIGDLEHWLLTRTMETAVQLGKSGT